MAGDTKLGVAQIPIRATLDELDKDLAGVRGHVESALAGVQNLGKIALGGLAAGALAVGGAIATIGPAAVGAASDLNESMSKANVVFGDSIKVVDQFAASSASSFGIAKQTAYEAAGTFGNLFVTMGLGKNKAADMSVDIVELAADLASFNNIKPEEALEKLRAGLVGETEPLRSLGVNLTADAIKAKAMAMGLARTTTETVIAADAAEKLAIAQAKHAAILKKYGADSLQARQSALNLANAEAYAKGKVESSTQELTPAMKAQAAYALIMEQTKTAQGDFARTSDGLANTQRILQATFKDISAEIGTALLPGVLGIAKSVAPLVKTLMPKLQDVLTKLSPVIEDTGLFFGAFIDGLIKGSDPIHAFVGAFEQFGDIFPGLQPAIEGLVSNVQGLLAGIQPTIDQATAWIAQNLKLEDVLIALGVAIAAVVIPAIISVAAAAAPIIAAFVGLVLVVALLRQAWESNWGGIRETLTTFWEGTAKPALTELWNWLQVNVPAAITTLSNFWNNTLLPALTAVWNFINEFVLPGFRSVANVVSAVVGKAVEALAGLWQNVLKKALTEVWEFIDGPLGSVLKWLGENILPKIKDVFGAIGDAIKTMQGGLSTLADSIRGLKLPAWLTPGSPTPFETGLLGISAAAQQAGDSLNAMRASGLNFRGGALNMSTRMQAMPELVERGNGLSSADTYNQQQTRTTVNVNDPLTGALVMRMFQQQQRGQLNARMG